MMRKPQTLTHPAILVAHTSGRIIGELDNPAVGLGLKIRREFFPFSMISKTEGKITKRAMVVTLPNWHTVYRKMHRPPAWTRDIRVTGGKMREPPEAPPPLAEYRRWNPSW